MGSIFFHKLLICLVLFLDVPDVCEGLAQAMIAFKTILRTKHEHSTSSDGHDQADSAEFVALAFASHRVSARGVRHAATTLKGTRRGWVSFS